MGQRLESKTFRFVTGALLTVALLASGYLLGVTQFAPTSNSELDEVRQAMEWVDRSLTVLTDQVVQVASGLEALQDRLDHQGAEVEALSTALAVLSGQVEGQGEATAAQIQALAALAPAPETDNLLLDAISEVDGSVAELAEQVARLQLDLANLATRSQEQDEKLQSLAGDLKTLAADLAQRDSATFAQLQALTNLKPASETDSLLQAIGAIDSSVVGLTEQVARLQLDLADLAVLSQGQGEDLQSLTGGLHTLAEELAQRYASTAAQLQALAAAIEELAALVSSSAIATTAQAGPETVPVPTEELAIPASTVMAPHPIGASEEAEATVQRNALVLRIKAKDTIWAIANRFQTPPSQQFIEEIIELNQVDPYRLHIGQELLIPLVDGIFTLIEVE